MDGKETEKSIFPPHCPFRLHLGLLAIVYFVFIYWIQWNENIRRMKGSKRVMLEMGTKQRKKEKGSNESSSIADNEHWVHQVCQAQKINNTKNRWKIKAKHKQPTTARQIEYFIDHSPVLIRRHWELYGPRVCIVFSMWIYAPFQFGSSLNAMQTYTQTHTLYMRIAALCECYWNLLQNVKVKVSEAR